MKKSAASKVNSEKKELDIINLRKSIDKFYRDLLNKVVIPDDIKIIKERLNFNDHTIEATIYIPSATKKFLPVIIFHPGGGLALNMAYLHAHACANICKIAQAAVVCIQPELSPDRKLDEILQAAYHATKYFYQNADKYSLDQTQFLISGYSMGGTLAMLITNQAKKDLELKIAGQIIISGVFDLANPPTAADKDYMFDSEIHCKFIEMCLPKNRNIKTFNQSEFSLMTANLQNLPPTCLIAGEYDAFKSDTKKMATLLKNQYVNVKTIIIPKQIHNTLLLNATVSDNPAIIAGEAAKELLTAK